MDDEEFVVPGRVYKKTSKVCDNDILLVFFAEGDCVVYYPSVDTYKYFISPNVQGLSLADIETERNFLLDVRRALFNAIQVR